MPPKNLVLGPLTSLWPEDEDSAVFLGPWCFAFNQKYEFWEQTRFSLAANNWIETGDLRKSNDDLGRLYQRLVPSLANELNAFQERPHSEVYWATLLAPWAVHFLGVFFDRYQRLKLALSQPGPWEILTLPEQAFPIKDYAHFSRLSGDPFYNTLLLSDILRHLPGENILLKVAKGPAPEQKGFPPPPLKTKIKAWLLGPRFENQKAVLGSVYGISLRERMCLVPPQPFKFFSRSIRVLDSKEPNWAHLRLPLGFKAENEFEKILCQVIKRAIPTDYYKSYIFNFQQPRIFIGNDIYHESTRAAQIATTREEGGKWLSVQHGGGYGNYKEFPLGKIEYEIANGFISWGWKTHDHFKHGKPLPSPLLSKLAETKISDDGLLLYITTSHFPYTYRLHSALQPDQQLDFLTAKKTFLNTLSPSIRHKILYRAYHIFNGINEKRFLKEVLSDHQYFREKSIKTQMAQSRIVIVDHLSTSWLESLAMNKPTLVFWDEKIFESCPEHHKALEKFLEVGVYHQSAQSAADFLNRNYMEIEKWWRDAKTQSAVKNYLKHFALTSPHWKKDWSQFLRENLP